jgi:zinc and cadmium transporter
MLGVALGLSLVTTLANVIGSILAIFGVRTGAASRLRWLLGFAGGFILGGALAEVLPESFAEAPTLAPLLALGGYLLLYGVEQVFAHRAHPVPTNAREHTLVRELEGSHPPITFGAGMVALAGLLLHDFIDGLGIGAGFVEGAEMGIFMLVAVLLHEAPAGVAAAALMLGAGRGRMAALLAGVSIGLITLVAVPIPFWTHVHHEGLAAGFRALAAGSFLFISTHSLIPAGMRGTKGWGFLAVPLGAAMALLSAYLIHQFIGHEPIGHEHTGHDHDHDH